MTRAQFLNDLYRRLNGLSAEQAEQHLTYYAEMLADRMEEGMNEEEAVASMEDVEVIARRILEEEGLPYVGVVTPPAYPDASRIPGGGGNRAYQPPKPKKWQKYAKIGLWSLAVLIALGTLASKLSSSDRPVQTTHEAMDSAWVEETAPIDATDYGWYAEESSDLFWQKGWEPIWNWGYEIIGNPVTLLPDEIDKISVKWNGGSGMVQVLPSNGGEIAFAEVCYHSGQHASLTYKIDGDTLYLEGNSGGRALLLAVPSGLMHRLEISTASSDIHVSGVDIMDTLELSSTSGEIRVEDLYAVSTELSATSGEIYPEVLITEDLSLSTSSGEIHGSASAADFSASTTSGEIFFTLMGCVEVEARSTRGDIALNVQDNVAEELSVTSSSGNVGLTLPYKNGFALDYTTISGDFYGRVYDREMHADGSTHMDHGDASTEINVETTSGNLELLVH